MKYILAHTGEQTDTVPINIKEALFLSEQGTEVLPNNDGKVLIYPNINQPIENIEHYQILHKFISIEGIEKLSKRIRELKLSISNLQESFSASNTNIDGLILELKSTRIDSNVLKDFPKRSKPKTLFDCFNLSDIAFTELVITAKNSLSTVVEVVAVTQTELASLKDQWMKVFATTSLQDLLAVYYKAKSLYDKIEAESFSTIFHKASECVDILSSAKSMCKKYKECLEEIVRRRSFFDNLKVKIKDFNEIVALLRNEELEKRKQFMSSTIGTSSQNKAILVNSLFPVLNHTLPEIALEQSSSNSNQSPTIWTKELVYEVQHLPKIQNEDVTDASWVNLNGTVLVSTNNKNAKNEMHDSMLDAADDVETDDDSLSTASHTDIVDYITHKDEAIQKKDKEIEQLKVSLSESISGKQSLEKEANIFKEKCVELENKIQEQQTTNENLSKALTEAQQKLEQAHCEFEKQKQQLRTQNDDEKKKLAITIAELQDAVAKTKSQSQDNESQLLSLRTQLKNTEKIAKDQSDYAAKISKEFESLTAIHATTKAAKDTAEKKVTEMSALLQAKQQDSQLLSNEKAAHQKEKLALSEKVKSLEKQLLEQKALHKSELDSILKEKERELNEIVTQSCKEQEKIASTNKQTLTDKAKEIEKQNKQIIEQEKKIAALEQQVKDLKQHNASPSVSPALKPKEIKIAVSDFSIDDIVFFKRKAKSDVWEVFNYQCPFFFLSDDAVKMLKQKTQNQYDVLEFVKAQVLYIDHVKATKDNPYGVPHQQMYHVVHIYPFE